MIWNPIETAPKEWVSEIKMDAPDIGPVIFRCGRPIKARDAAGEELVVHWAQQEGFGPGNGDTPHWWDWSEEWPLDWPITEWRELTAEERAEVYGGAA